MSIPLQTNLFPNTATLEGAKDRLFQNMDHTSPPRICPCCDQVVKIYRRKLHVTMARGLIWIYRKWFGSGSWVHIAQAPGQIAHGGDVAKLQFWDLITEQPGKDDGAKRTSGYWMPTATGREFVTNNQYYVPKYIYIYNNNLLQTSTENINIEQALGPEGRFHYQQLMSGT